MNEQEKKIKIKEMQVEILKLKHAGTFKGVYQRFRKDTVGIFNSSDAPEEKKIQLVSCFKKYLAELEDNKQEEKTEETTQIKKK